jgi:PAS domain S-box-containing protein
VEAERRANQLAYFLSKMREAVIVSDLEYRLIYWNQGAEQLYGYKSEEVIGKTAEELFQDDLDDELITIRRIVIETGEWNGGLHVCDRHGRKFFIESSWTLVRDSAGKPEAIISIANDVTDRKLVQDALRSSEERFARIFNLSPYRMGIIRISDGVILDVNECWQREIGFSREEIVNHPIFELDQWLGNEAMRQVRDRLAEAKPFDALEGVLKTKGGERRVALSSAVVVDFDGEPCYLWAANDITERKRAEESLQLSEKRFSIAFSSSPVLATISTLDGDFLDVNETFVTISGYSREETVGHPAREIKLWSRPEGRERLMSKLEQDGKVRGFEAYMRTKGGEERNMLLSVEKIELEGQTCLLHAGIDITERRQTEDENKKLLHHLGERVKELTALHNASRLLQQFEGDTGSVLQKLASLLPPAFQYPDVAAARVRLGEIETQTAEFVANLPVLHTDFVTLDGQRGRIEVSYLEERPVAGEGPFLVEERALIDTLADILKTAYDRSQSKLNLEASEERYRTLFETAPNSVRVFGSDQRLIMANQQAVKLFGYESAEEMIGMPAREFVAPADWPRVSASATEAIGTVVSHELTGVRRDGSHFDVESRLARILDENGEPRAFLSVSTDVTERKLAEVALKTSKEQLRALSAKMQSAREEEGTRIAREIHDELGSALTGLKWEIEKMDETLSRSLKGAGSAQIHKQIGAMTHLIESIIETVRRISSELRPVVLDDLGVVAAIQWQAQQFQSRTGIKYHWNTAVDTIELTRESATAVFRIFQEILTNVLRHSGATCIAVELQRSNGYLELKVKDDGRGISESEKVNTRSLGLLGMRERALLVGGEVNILGADGNGTTVVVRVPALE